MCQNVLHFVMEVHLSIVISLKLSFYFSETQGTLFRFSKQSSPWKDYEPDTEMPVQFLILLT